jgi:hypothetical protein
LATSAQIQALSSHAFHSTKPLYYGKGDEIIVREAEHLPEREITVGAGIPTTSRYWEQLK